MAQRDKIAHVLTVKFDGKVVDVKTLPPGYRLYELRLPVHYGILGGQVEIVFEFDPPLVTNDA
jgi:hypothetical protein